LLLTTNIVHAQSQAITKQVKKGDVVPFDGLIFNNLAAIRNKVYIENIGKLHANELEKLKFELELELQSKVDLLNIKLEHQNKTQQALLTLKEKEIQFLRNNFDPPGFFASIEGGIVIGVLATFTLVVITGYTLGQITSTNN
tara:strand:- start:16624 stop:17049 length:426 start_codon:yes stop_codon:yes gene_type:complete